MRPLAIIIISLSRALWCSSNTHTTPCIVSTFYSPSRRCTTTEKLSNRRKAPKNHSMTCIIIVLTCLLSALFLPTCHGDCIPFEEAPGFEETFEAYKIVARCVLADPPKTIQGCPVMVYNETLSEYVIAYEFPAYEIVELFKGDPSLTEIPIAWYVCDLPISLLFEASFFLSRGCAPALSPLC